MWDGWRQLHTSGQHWVIPRLNHSKNCGRCLLFLTETRYLGTHIKYELTGRINLDLCDRWMDGWMEGWKKEGRNNRRKMGTVTYVNVDGEWVTLSAWSTLTQPTSRPKTQLQTQLNTQGSSTLGFIYSFTPMMEPVEIIKSSRAELLSPLSPLPFFFYSVWLQLVQADIISLRITPSTLGTSLMSCQYTKKSEIDLNKFRNPHRLRLTKNLIITALSWYLAGT